MPGGDQFPWPSGTYVDTHEFSHVFMAMPTFMDVTLLHGVSKTASAGKTGFIPPP